MSVFYILVPIFLAIGIWLIVYSFKRGRLFKQFAETQNLEYRPDLAGKLEKVLKANISLPPPCGRTFSNVKDPVRDGRVILFRATELLDLNKYGDPQNSHFSRAAVLAELDNDEKAEARQPLLFLAERDGISFNDRHPEETLDPGDPIVQKIKSFLADLPPPHPLSVTIQEGYLLAYLEPLRVGSENEKDLHYLHNFAKQLANN